MRTAFIIYHLFVYIQNETNKQFPYTSEWNEFLNNNYSLCEEDIKGTMIDIFDKESNIISDNQDTKQIWKYEAKILHLAIPNPFFFRQEFGFHFI